jgi:hypothetical protein
MELDEAQQIYKSFNGDVSELENIDPSDYDYMIEVQKAIHDLTNKQDDDGEKELEEELESLNLQLAEHEINSDSYREIQNQIIMKENRIRTSLGMQEKPLFVLDSALMKLLALDGYSLGKNSWEYLSTIQDLGTRRDLQDRLENISANIQAELDRDERETAFLLWASSTLQECKNVPIAWTMKDGEILENPDYQILAY